MKKQLRLLGAALAITSAASLAPACQPQGPKPPASNESTNNATTGTNNATTGTTGATTGTTGAMTNNGTNNDTTAAATNAAPAPTGPVARVNGVEIPREKLNAELEDLKKRFAMFGGAMPPEQLKKFEEKIVGRLVEEELISQKLKTDSITVTDAEIDAELETQKQRMPGGQAQFDEFLKRSGITMERLRTDIGSRLALQKFLNKDKGLDVTDDEIKAEYEANKDKFTLQERVEASHILIKVGEDPAGAPPSTNGAPPAGGHTDAEAKKMADELYKLAIKKGTDFAELAKTKSEGPSAPQGGSLGTFERGRMVKEFEDAAFAAKVGEITKPVKTKFGYHIIKVTKKEPAGVQPLDQVKDQLKGRIEARKFRDAREKLLTELRTQGKVEML